VGGLDMDNVTSIILAGGRGKRMDILSHDKAKPMLSFAGAFHVIDFVLTNCLRSGIKDITALVDYQRFDVTSYLKQWHQVNGTGQSFQVLGPKDGSYRGTADAVYQNIEYFDKHGMNDVLILAADHIYKMDYRKMLAFHRKVEADATIGVVTVPIEEAYRFGIVKVNGDGKVIEFVEKPKIAKSNLVSMGIYIINRQTLLEYLNEDASDPNSPHDFGHAIIPKMITRKNVFAYKFNDYWQDIGTVDAYYQANMELLKQAPSFSLNTAWSVLTQSPADLQHSKIYRQNNVAHSLISPGCIIKGTVENSVLSTGVMIEQNAVVKNSIILAHTTVGQHSVVDRCILDENVSIGEYSYIGFTTNLSSGTRDITILGKGSTVPSNTAIGRNCKVLPGVEPDDFLKKAIPPNTVLAHV
jgi:glucose-1-phosphate adenylyltransferase